MATTLKIGLGALAFVTVRLMAQQPTLTITSPVDRGVVHTGETFSVNVEASGGRFVGVALIPPSPIPWATVRKEPPFTFTFRIPEKMRPGLYPFVAMGKTDSQQQVPSNRAWIDIERPDQPVSIGLEPDGPYAVRRGAPNVIDVLGTYKNGDTVVLNQSLQTKFVSEDPKIVAIHDYGEIIGVAEGTTNIVIQVGGKRFRQRVTVKNNE